MALPDAVKGGKRPSPLLTWSDDSGTVLDLSDATITAVILDANSQVERAADGTFTVTDGPAGEFRWDYGTNDVATKGTFIVQFTAVFPANPSPAKTFGMSWRVR